MPFLAAKNRKFISLTSLSILAIIFLDNVIGKFLLGSLHDRTNTAIIFFSLIFLGSLILKMAFIYSVWKSKSSYSNIKFSRILFLLSTVVIIASVVLSFITFSLLTYSIMAYKTYDLRITLPAIVFNVLSAMLILGILATRFVLWFIKNPKLLSLLFILSIILFLIVSILALTNILLQYGNQPTTITPYANPIDRTTLKKVWSSEAYKITSIMLFIVTWLATSILLRKYFLLNKRSSKKLLIVIVLIPVIYYLTTSDYVVNYINKIIPPSFAKSITVDIAVGSTKHIGGIYFAIGFLYMYKNITNENLRHSLLFTSLGLMLLFSSLTLTILLYSAFPPFGIIAISFVPLGSYVLFYGLYFSVRTIVADEEFVANLRQGLRNADFSFLGDFGKSDWNKSFESTVEDLLKNKITHENSQYSTLTHEDIQLYIDEVLDEIKKSKNQI
ncbi:MAG TPA: hypothetical protein VFV86_02235 [Nitrososphaeraceae archaeon]|nr:hypothetical protein [Nitrososphaeraceae archaeon]